MVANKNNSSAASIERKIFRCVPVAQWTSNPKFVAFKSASNYSSLPRAVRVVCFRLVTVHDLQNRVGTANSDCCPLWDDDLPMTGDHINIYPAVLNSISFNVVYWASSDCFYRSSLYWAARQLMTGRSETGYNIKE
ncbi:hypothetical protein TNCV_734021 [Trichonephila clavipes]|nr:hypothetical protein TNCV_734021 [Trichonephila clavipes]